MTDRIDFKKRRRELFAARSAPHLRQGGGGGGVMLLLLASAALLLLGATDSAALSCTIGDGRDAAQLSPREAVGQMMMIGFRGAVVDEGTAAMLADIQPGGIVLFDHDVASKGSVVRNIVSPEQLRTLIAQLQKEAAIPYLIAIDVEGGFINRLKAKYGFDLSVPSAQRMGEQSPVRTAQVADRLALALKELGINWNFAPVVDVNVDPASPAIGALERSFSADPEAVTAHAEAFIDGLRAHGIIPTLKHFPGHGSAAGDTHLGVTDVTDTYQAAQELAPYRRLIVGGYDDPIMTAHIVNRELDASGRPGTLSTAVMTRLLREEMGFDGVIVSDDMQMGAIVSQYGLAEAVLETVRAGVDIIMLANQNGEYDLQQVYEVRDAMLQAVADGAIAPQRVCDAVQRIGALRDRYAIR